MQFVRLIGPALIILTEIVGVIAALVLLSRKAGGGAGLALAGFGLLLLSTLCSLTTELPMVQRLIAQEGGGAARRLFGAGVGLSCATSGLMVLGLALLITAVTTLARKRA